MIRPAESLLRRTLRRAICVLAVMLCLSPAWGQTVRVQSGEHADFTRLVLDIGIQRDWRLVGVADRVLVVLDPPVDGFDISRVFDLIPRTRLAALSVRDGLELSLACPCEIDASRYQGRYLLLDIREAGPAPRPAPNPPPSPRGGQGLLPDTARLLLGPGPSLTPIVPQGAPAIAEAGPSDAPGGTAIDLEEAARIMAEQLARAAAAGLLDAAATRPMTDADPLTGPDRTQPQPGPPSIAARPETPPGLPLRAETALDLSPPLAFAAPLAEQAGLRCSGEVWAMNDWPAGEGLHEGLGPLRLGLFDDRDQLQSEAVMALARHYLAFGFGAEAGFWLGQVEDVPPHLVALSALVDQRPGPHFPPEPDALVCSDDELLWRYLDAAFDPASLTPEDGARLQRATAALPASLRDQIAPRIARALHTDGFVNEARNLHDMLWRAGQMDPAALMRLDRDLDLPLTDPEATREALSAALRDAGAEAVAAMAHAMRIDREMDLTASPEMLEAAEALLRESGLQPDAIPLWQEVVLARATASDLERMVQLLSADALPESARDDALTLLFAERARKGDTPALLVLAHVFGPTWQAAGSEAGRARVAAISHLRAVGLTDAAQRMQAGQRLLVLPAGPGLVPDGQTGLQAAWQEGDWARIGAMAAVPHRSIAARLEGGDVVALSDATADLARLSERLADSRSLRAEIEALFANPAPSPAGELE